MSLTPAAYLELGNFDAADGKYDDAIAWYAFGQRAAAFATGGVRLFQSGRFAKAAGQLRPGREAYYRVIDMPQTPGNALTPFAYLAIGQMYLWEDDAERARTALSRAVNVASGSEARPAAAPGVSRCLLARRQSE